jgi:hypothetical protein
MLKREKRPIFLMPMTGEIEITPKVEANPRGFPQEFFFYAPRLPAL